LAPTPNESSLSSLLAGPSLASLYTNRGYGADADADLFDIPYDDGDVDMNGDIDTPAANNADNFFRISTREDAS